MEEAAESAPFLGGGGGGESVREAEGIPERVRGGSEGGGGVGGGAAADPTMGMRGRTQMMRIRSSDLLSKSRVRPKLVKSAIKLTTPKPNFEFTKG